MCKNTSTIKNLRNKKYVRLAKKISIHFDTKGGEDMARGIRGITVRINGDTVGLEKSLKDVNKTSRNLQSELNDVQKMLKFNPRDVTLMAQQQRLLTDQVENTSKKLGQLKAAQAQVLVQFQRGEISAETYRNFQREVIATEKSLKTAEDALKDLAKEEANVQKTTKELDRLFEATGNSIDDFSDVLGTKLINSIKNGTASSKDLKKAFDLVGKAALGADADIDKIRASVNKLESGKTSIKKVQKELKQVAKDAEDAGKDVENLGGKLGELGGAAGGLAAGLGIGAIVEKSLDTSAFDTAIDISFNVPEEAKESIKDVARTMQAYGIESEASLEGIRRQWALNGDKTNEENARIAKSAGVITKAFSEIDFTELIQETNEMAGSMNMTQEEALGMTNTLLRAGFPPGEVDIISEYGSQLARAGYNASEIQGIFHAGIATKSWNIDVLLDKTLSL
jgi:phage-related minor tail protein